MKENIEHELKTWPEYFDLVWEGSKTFELRKNDRDYKVLDKVLLKEHSLVSGDTGRSIEILITHILTNVSAFGLIDGYCIISFKILSYND